MSKKVIWSEEGNHEVFFVNWRTLLRKLVAFVPLKKPEREDLISVPTLLSSIFHLSHGTGLFLLLTTKEFHLLILSL